MVQNLYVLGHPVGHSKSPVMHNAAYRALGLEWEYGLADCATEAEARAFLEKRTWMALNVTMPYKPLALSVSTKPSDEARVAQGANVLVACGDELFADNTDGKGCIAYLARCGVPVEGRGVVVCGTGPTSLALMHAAAKAGASRIALLGRDANKARSVLGGYRSRAREARALPSADLAAGDYDSAYDAIERADIILDATPLGMRAGDPAPFDTALLSAGQTVFDVVYGHGETTLIAAARERGCAAFDGYGMLVAQAVETVNDIVAWLDLPLDLFAVDLFDIMWNAGR